MNRILILLSLFLGLDVKESTSQTYHPFPDSSAMWRYLIIEYPLPGFPSYYYDGYSLGGDTTIGNYTYKIISSYGAIREDSNKTIYYYAFSGGSIPAHTEAILYQFGLDVGDTIISNNNFWIIEGIDSILLTDGYRKRYSMGIGTLTGWDFWIEGIGSTRSFFTPWEVVYEFPPQLICFEENGTLIYPNDSTTDCLTVHVYEMDVARAKVRASPNPFQNAAVINIENPKALKLKISIYNSVGKEIFNLGFNNSHAVELDGKDYPSGVYFYTLSTKSQLIDFGKIIKN